MILPNSYETILDKIKQDWFIAGYESGKQDCEEYEFGVSDRVYPTNQDWGPRN